MKPPPYRLQLWQDKDFEVALHMMPSASDHAHHYDIGAGSQGRSGSNKVTHHIISIKFLATRSILLEWQNNTKSVKWRETSLSKWKFVMGNCMILFGERFG